MDWSAVKNAGIRHAMLRAGYGTAGTDPQFKRNVAGCQLHGVHWGAYWYSYATTPRRRPAGGRPLPAAAERG